MGFLHEPLGGGAQTGLYIVATTGTTTAPVVITTTATTAAATVAMVGGDDLTPLRIINVSSEVRRCGEAQAPSDPLSAAASTTAAATATGAVFG